MSDNRRLSRRPLTKVQRGRAQRVHARAVTAAARTLGRTLASRQDVPAGGEGGRLYMQTTLTDTGGITYHVTTWATRHPS